MAVIFIEITQADLDAGEDLALLAVRRALPDRLPDSAVEYFKAYGERPYPIRPLTFTLVTPESSPESTEGAS
jgi:hypothetical protein